MKSTYGYAWLGALFVASAIGGAACSSSDNNNNDNNDKTDGGPGKNDGGGDPDGGGGGKTSLKNGNVTLFNMKTTYSGTPVQNYTASASFFDATGMGGGKGGTGCQESTEGSCQIMSCPKTSTGDGGTVDAGAPKIVHAGAIDISGALIAPAIRLQPDADNTYKAASEQKSIWSGGEDIKIQAAGNSNGVGAFNRTMKAPSIIQVTKPTWTEPALDRSKELELEWSFDGAGSGKTVLLLTRQASDKTVLVTCSYDVVAKKAKVPPSVLGKIPAGEGSFGMRTDEKSQLEVGDWLVNVTLMAVAARTDGAASGSATFQ